MMVQTTEDTDVRRMFNARPFNKTPTAIRDTMMLWFHMAILKKRQRTINSCKPEPESKR